MQINHVTQGAYLSVSNSGETITVGGLSIDLGQRQSDTAQIIEISQDSAGNPVEGNGAHWFLAHIHVPKSTYTMIDTGQTDPMTGDPVMSRQRNAIDMSMLRVDLWALPTGAQ